MNNFSFKNPTKIFFGKGEISKLATEIPAEKRIMITFGGGSVRTNGVYDQVKNALKHHFTVEFWGIEPNPDYETLLKAVIVAQENNIDFLLAVGGGSVLDGTKFISQAMSYNSDPWKLVKDARLCKPSVPVASVMTLPATGSEMNCRAVISYRAKKEKLAFMSEYMFPVFSILDPEVTFSIPQKQLSNGVVDTFMHVMEQYMTYPVQAFVMDRWAEGILKTLIEIGEKVVHNHNDYNLMANYMICATLALNDIIGMGVPQDWATHRVGHDLTAVYGLDHAETLAVLYPALLKVTRTEKQDKLLQYAEQVWNIKEKDPEKKIDAAIEMTEQFFRKIGLKTRLHEYQINNEAIEIVAERVRLRGLVYGEHKNIDAEKVKEIIKLAL
ncbi:iron-containing alcohol dehydrogenase [Parabacteroides sp. FAFU027]|uniref:iron-containing alcohol dehydrogenase n=1 Tax=Parabacteroides sp. FAFU027 TaxID=2922715 RepID=UPI001FB0072F|nr:iron-containing alcohol dehydrogenase [Parabacteroides sp. FAFU027]